MALDLVIEPRTDRYEPDDDRWLAQANELYINLRSEVGGLRRKSAPVRGTKGTIETLILVLGSANALAAAVERFRHWLRRDKTRSLHMSWTIDGHEHTATVRGDVIDQSTFQVIAEALAQHLGKES
jgi:hypothetical protein